MGRTISMLGYGLLGFLMGCATLTPKETTYLKSAVDHATRDEVRQHLGEPRAMSSTQAGDALWLYEIRALEPGSQSSWSAAGSWCDEYRLVFDQGGVLRQWTHRSYFHGGETMPASCGPPGAERAAL